MFLRTIKFCAIALSAVCALGTIPIAHANTDKDTAKVTVKNFGDWEVLSSARWSNYPPYMEIAQAHNRNEADIGDMIHIQWHPTTPQISVRFQVFCSDQGELYSADAKVNTKHWLAIGSASATTQVRVLVNGWMKDAARKCPWAKPSSIFKMAQIKPAMREFLQGITNFEASEKARGTL
jgi:hypothetical protein